LSAYTLLDRAQAIETAFGRQRTDVVNAPRTLDVDLIVVGDRHADDENLVLPHPRAHERAFVLVPWAAADPEAVIPGTGPVAELLEKVDRSGVEQRDDLRLQLS
jgi:2-amino-4-hydroxy-6-hydroxymethyldihydropteridine diphosphokinase